MTQYCSCSNYLSLGHLYYSVSLEIALRRLVEDQELPDHMYYLLKSFLLGQSESHLLMKRKLVRLVVELLVVHICWFLELLGNV